MREGWGRKEGGWGAEAPPLASEMAGPVLHSWHGACVCTAGSFTAALDVSSLEDCGLCESSSEPKHQQAEQR